jgi:antirestriction protein ArdC
LIEYASSPTQQEDQTQLRNSFQLAIKTEKSSYSGINSMLLTSAFSRHAYTRNYWLTMKQANTEFGRLIQSGSKREQILHWSIPKCSSNGCPGYGRSWPRTDCQHIQHRRSGAKWFDVFNVSSVGGEFRQRSEKKQKTESVTVSPSRVSLEDQLREFDQQWIRLLPSPDTRRSMTIKRLERMFVPEEWNKQNQVNEKMKDRVSLSIGESHRAFFDPNKNQIVMPDPRLFQHEQIEYWLTLFHELSHAADHALHIKKKTEQKHNSPKEEDDEDDDTLIQHSATDSYGWGELVAEMGSGFIAARLGVEVEEKQKKNQVAYLHGWLNTLSDTKQNDRDKQLVWASSRAAKAADYVLDHWLVS